MKRKLIIRLMLGSLFYASFDNAAAQTVIRPIYPEAKAVCESAWESNFRSFRSIGEEVNVCRSKCLAEWQASFRAGDYSPSVCGGDLASSGPNALASYAACAPTYERQQRFLTELKLAHTECLSAVEKRGALERVLESSVDSSKLPSQLDRANEVAANLNGQVSTGNPLVDGYREKAQQGAVNAASTLMADGIAELDAIVSQQTAEYLTSYNFSARTAAAASTPSVASQINSAGAKWNGRALQAAADSVDPAKASVASSSSGSSTQCGDLTPDVTDLVTVYRSVLGSEADSIGRQSIASIVAQCGTAANCASLTQQQIAEYHRALQSSSCSASKAHADACQVLNFGIAVNERMYRWLACHRDNSESQ